jgi:hypothetical protein
VKLVGTTALEIPGAPTSRNVLDSKHWRVRQRERKDWHARFLYMLRGSDLPRHVKRVRAEALITFAQHRRRDEGNFRATLEKALGDALQTGEYLDDDTPETFTFGEVRFATGKPQTTTVKIEWEA